MQATIEDISKITGLSISIISRYLNGHNVRKENKVLIDEAIKKTGYTPNTFARNLRITKTNTIGVIIPALIDNFANYIIYYLEDNLVKNGYSIVVSNSNYSHTNEVLEAKRMVQRKVDALVLLPFGDFSEISDLAKGNDIPLIVFDQYFSNVLVDYVLFQNSESSKKATDILFDYGHKRIAILTGPLTGYTPSQRLNGVRRSFNEHGVKLDNDLIFAGSDYTTEIGYDLMKKVIALKNRPTAIFATNYGMTFGAIKAINEANLLIPDDFSIMGFDALSFCEIVKPKIWTVVQPVEKIGMKMSEMIIEKLNNKEDNDYKTIYVNYELIQGNSIKRI